jgi:hypothetical protein
MSVCVSVCLYVQFRGAHQAPAAKAIKIKIYKKKDQFRGANQALAAKDEEIEHLRAQVEREHILFTENTYYLYIQHILCRENTFYFYTKDDNIHRLPAQVSLSLSLSLNRSPSCSLSLSLSLCGCVCVRACVCLHPPLIDTHHMHTHTQQADEIHGKRHEADAARSDASRLQVFL